MNTAALLKLLDLLVSENPKGKGRGRNAHRFTVLLGLAFIAWNVRDVPELKRDVAEVRARVSSIEARLGVTRKALDTPAASRDELGSAAPGAVTPPRPRAPETASLDTKHKTKTELARTQ